MEKGHVTLSTSTPDLELGKGAEPGMNSCHVSWDGARLVTL